MPEVSIVVLLPKCSRSKPFVLFEGEIAILFEASITFFGCEANGPHMRLREGGFFGRAPRIKAQGLARAVFL
eukprot:11205870-Lingulodinium_polyedra.AAC.1